MMTRIIICVKFLKSIFISTQLWVSLHVFYSIIFVLPFPSFWALFLLEQQIYPC